MDQSPDKDTSPQDASNRARWSLLCGVLSFVICALPAIPAIYMGHMALDDVRKGKTHPNERAYAMAGLSLGYANLIIFGILLSVVLSLFASIDRARDASRRGRCMMNLQQVVAVMELYAKQSDRAWPPASFPIARLSNGESYLETLTSPFICPTLDESLKLELSISSHLYDLPYFIYTGYYLANDEDAQAFLDYLRTPEGKSAIRAGTPLIETAGGQRFARIETISGKTDPQGIAPITAPVFIERPTNHGSGGCVVYADGHVRWMKYPGVWPMTPQSIQTFEMIVVELRALDETAPSKEQSLS